MGRVKQTSIRMGSIAAVCIGSLLGLSTSATAASLQTNRIASDLLTSSEIAPAASGCPFALPYSIPFYEPNGLQPPDLVTCTNRDETKTYIDNTSEDTVWLVNRPTYPYWSSAQTVNLSVAVQLFRAGMRHTRPNPSTLYPTIEPGIAATFDTNPKNVGLNQNAEEQSAWQMSNLLVDTVNETSFETATEILAGKEGSARSVLASCVADAFKIGKSFTTSDPTTNYQQMLSNDYANVKSAKDCGSKINSLDEKLKVADRESPISIPKIEQEAPTDLEWTRTNGAVEDAIRAAEDLVLH